MIEWLSKHKFQAHLAAFLLMIISSIGMIFSVQQDNSILIWLLVTVFAVANILAILIK